MSYRLSELAEHLAQSGIPCRVEGDPDRQICDIATLEEAGPAELSFLSNARYASALATTAAGAVIVSEDQPIPDGVQVLRTADPYAAWCMLMVHIYGYRRHPGEGVHPDAVIDESASIGPNPNIRHGVTISRDVSIGGNVVLYPGCYIAANCRLGDDCNLYPNVVIYDGCVLGDRVTIHAGTVIGEDGLGYAPVGDKWHKIPQVGRVEIANDVEIGSNCSIDRAALGATVIGAGSKFSNLIAIGHGTKIGPDCMLVAQVGIAGSVAVGRHVTMAGKVGVAGHLEIGDNAQIAGMSGVMGDVPPGKKMLGLPATEMQDQLKSWSLVRKLPEMRAQIRRLESQVAELRRAAASSG